MADGHSDPSANKGHKTGKPGVKTRARGRATRARLIEAALALYAIGGESLVTIASVAKRAGVTRRAAYHHFLNHDELRAEMKKWMNDKFKDAESAFDSVDDQIEFLTTLAAEDENLIRSQIMQALNNGARNSPVLTHGFQRFKDKAAHGDLRASIDPEMGAIIGFSAWFGLLLALSLARTDEEKKALADRYHDSLVELYEGGLFDPHASAPPGGRS